ncbi:MAG: hypothetical protein H7X77_02385 [Anaerolineae bacterium]|nr:hypothetical protein [Anaerolineae bacterium]
MLRNSTMPETNRMLILLLLATISATLFLTLLSWDASPVTFANSPSVFTDCQPRTEWVSYILPDGESLETIARRVGISVSMLAAANCLTQQPVANGITLYIPALPAS